MCLTCRCCTRHTEQVTTARSGRRESLSRRSEWPPARWCLGPLDLRPTPRTFDRWPRFVPGRCFGSTGFAGHARIRLLHHVSDDRVTRELSCFLPRRRCTGWSKTWWRRRPNCSGTHTLYERLWRSRGSNDAAAAAGGGSPRLLGMPRGRDNSQTTHVCGSLCVLSARATGDEPFFAMLVRSVLSTVRFTRQRS